MSERSGKLIDLLYWVIGSLVNFVVTWFILGLLAIFIAMIVNFFTLRKDSHAEVLDTSTVITVPDQSLSVRDILTRFSRGQIEIPPIDYGDDDDINSEVTNFDDIVDAQNFMESAKVNLENISNEVQQSAKVEEKQSDTITQADDLTT